MSGRLTKRVTVKGGPWHGTRQDVVHDVERVLVPGNTEGHYHVTQKMMLWTPKA